MRSLTAAVVWTVLAAASAASTTRSLLVIALVATCTFTLTVLTRAHPLVGAGAVAGVLGAGVSAEVLDSPGPWRWLAAGAVACLVAATFADRLSLVLGSRQPARMAVLGTVVCLASMLARAAPATFGRGASGALDVFGISFRVGELTRPAFIVGLALVVAGRVDSGRRHAGLAALCSTAVMVLELAALRDYGPALLVLVAAWLVWAHAARSSRAFILPAVAVGAPAALLWPLLPSYVHERFTQVFAADDAVVGQVAAARAVLARAGLFGGIGPEPIRAVAHATTDYAVVSAIGLVGYVMVAAVMATLMLAYSEAAGRLRSRDDASALIGVGALTLLFCQSVLTALGPLGLGPVTGLPAPLLSITGSAILPVAVLVGCVVGAAPQPLTVNAGSSSVSGTVLGQATRQAALLTVVVMVAVALVRGLVVQDLPGAVTIALDRGSIVTSDGHVVTPRSAGLADRTYPDGPKYLSVGWVGADSEYGLERTMDDALTCGAAMPWWRRLMQDVVAVPCRPADLVLTLRADVMDAAAAATTLAGDATIVVADARTGAVLADYSTGLERRLDANGRSLAAGGLAGPQSAPSRMNATAPGSVAKLFTVASSVDHGITATPDLGMQYITTSGSRVRNMSRSACPGTSLDDVLAYSCNTGAAWLAEQVGATALDEMLHSTFGFGQQTIAGLSVTPAVSGLGDEADEVLPQVGFGQAGMRMSALAVTQGLVQLACSGDPVALTYVAGIRDDSSAPLRAAPAAATGASPERALSEPACEVLLSGARAAVQDGTAQELREVLHGHDVVAKTGSADVQRDSVAMTDHWTVAMVDQRWAVTVVVRGTHDNPDPAQSHASLSVVRRVLAALPPDLLAAGR